MVRRVFMLSFVVMLSVPCVAQEMADIFDRKAKITWLGIDFTGAKFIGDRERYGSHADVKDLMLSYNNLMLKEPDKFDMGLAIDKIRVADDFSVTNDHNAELNIAEIFSTSEGDYFHLRPNDIIEIIANYDFKGKTGIGVMINVESFNKFKKEGCAWITFVDMGKKDVFFSERVTGEPGGAGLRNYWGNAIYDMLKATRKKEFEMWRKKYYRKF
jgi:hypothetical protein